MKCGEGKMCTDRSLHNRPLSYLFRTHMFPYNVSLPRMHCSDLPFRRSNQRKISFLRQFWKFCSLNKRRHLQTASRNIYSRFIQSLRKLGLFCYFSCSRPRFRSTLLFTYKSAKRPPFLVRLHSPSVIIICQRVGKEVSVVLRTTWTFKTVLLLSEV